MYGDYFSTWVVEVLKHVEVTCPPQKWLFYDISLVSTSVIFAVFFVETNFPPDFTLSRFIKIGWVVEVAYVRLQGLIYLYTKFHRNWFSSLGVKALQTNKSNSYFRFYNMSMDNWSTNPSQTKSRAPVSAS